MESLIFTQGGFGEGLLDGEIPLPSPESGLPGQVIQDPEFEHSSQQGVSVDVWIFRYLDIWILLSKESLQIYDQTIELNLVNRDGAGPGQAVSWLR